MLSRWQWLLLQFARRLWVRVSLFALFAVATALVGALVAPVVPSDLPGEVGADALDNILGILASSMLAVTTFSLTTMVAAYTAATSNATPRSSRLLMDDPTTQNALGTFIGSFVFALVGIIALTTGAYGEQGRLVLFGMTLLVVVSIIVTLLRWIDYLSRVGRVGEVTDKVEREAARALEDRLERPYLGGRLLEDADRQVPEDACAVRSPKIGYVQFIDMPALERCGRDHGGRVFVRVLPGTFVDPSRTLASVEGIDDEDLLERIGEAFTIEDDRSFDQDPRFGLCVLAEIGSRALSPGVNDPGTAIDVIGSGVRVLAAWAGADQRQVDGADDPGCDSDCPHVFVPPLETEDLFDDFFGPIARDGAALVEIQIRLQKGLATLARLGGERTGRAARRHSARALELACQGLALEADKAIVREIAAGLEDKGRDGREKAAP